MPENKASEQKSTSAAILLLADDQQLRQTMARPLARAGLMVLETRSGKEADKLVAQHSLCAVVVDARLRDCDGIAWVKKLREDGKDVPAVVLSDNWSERPKLQSICQLLNVRLILQKPIMPDILLQQLRAVIPGCGDLSEHYTDKPDHKTSAIKQKTTAKSGSRSKSGEKTKPGIAPSAETDAIEEPELVEPEPDEFEVEVMRSLNVTMHQQQEQQIARAQYAQSLQMRTHELLQSLNRCKAQPENGVIMSEAIQFAHRMRTTSASFGMPNVSEAAGRVEDLLLGLREADEDSRQIIWSQITRSMDEIKNLSAIAGGSTAHITDVPYLSRKIILLGDATRFAKESAELAQAGIADTIIVNSVEAAQRRVRLGNVDGIVIDFGLEHSDEILSFIFNTRLQYVDAPPVALMGAHARALQHYERLYLGSSLTLDSEADPLSTYAQSLIAVANSQKRRVLIVSDDANVKQTVAAVLGSAGFHTKNVDDAARIFRELHQFAPDAVIISEQLRDASGYDVCRILRASNNYKTMPLLLLGANVGRATSNAAFAVGANDMLGLPVVPDQLIERVREQVQLRRMQQIGREIGDDGLYTRRAMTAKLSQMCSGKGSFSLAMVAIKKFDVIGLRHGLRAQDATSELACALLRSRFRYQDLRGRWSESTFMVVFPGESISVASAAVSLLCDEFARCELYSPSGSTFKPSLSFGLAMKDAAVHDPDKLLDSAYKHLNAATYA